VKTLDDLLRGAASADVLLGGLGADAANGGDGIDRCRAQVRRR